jgi:2-hydroxychromene-2-carboxylate isomerase
MPRRVEVFYDVVCPYAYLGTTQIGSIADRAGAEVVWKPFLLGGVLKALDNLDPNEAMSEAKKRHNFLDMRRWAAHFGVPLNIPESHPMRTVLAMRALLAAGEKARVPATRALFETYWVRGEDITDPSVVAAALTGAGVDGDACVARASDDEIKTELRTRTDEALERGVFGAPTFFVGDEMFWGQDRLHFVERALARAL